MEQIKSSILPDLTKSLETSLGQAITNALNSATAPIAEMTKSIQSLNGTLTNHIQNTAKISSIICIAAK